MFKKMLEKIQDGKNITYNKIKKMSDCEKLELIIKGYNIDGDEYNEKNVTKAYISFFGFGKLLVKMKNQKVFVDGKYEAWVEGFDNYGEITLPKWLYLKSKDDLKEYDLTEINEKLIKECKG